MKSFLGNGPYVLTHCFGRQLDKEGNCFPCLQGLSRLPLVFHVVPSEGRYIFVPGLSLGLGPGNHSLGPPPRNRRVSRPSALPTDFDPSSNSAALPDLPRVMSELLMPVFASLFFTNPFTFVTGKICPH